MYEPPNIPENNAPSLKASCDTAASASGRSFRAYLGFDLIPFAILALMQIFDWHSTVVAMGQGREEMNPIILALAQYVGLLSAVTIYKFIATSLTVVYFIFTREYRGRKMLNIPLYLVLFTYGFFIFNNYS